MVRNIRLVFQPRTTVRGGTFKPIESPVTEEEIEFGCYDFRPHIYATVRNLEWQPSLNSANEDHLKTIKEWMQEKKGKEGEKRIFSIIDKCFSDIYEAYVYRSPHAARRYGDVLICLSGLNRGQWCLFQCL